MSGLRQTWHHSERGAVAGLRLLGIGVVLLAVATVAIYKFNPDKEPATPTTTTTPAPETSTPETSTPETSPPETSPPETSPPETQLLTATLPLRCDNDKYALVAAPFNGQQTDVLSDLRKTAETSGRQALIVSARLCDAVGANTTYTGPRELIFIGPFDDDGTACRFIDELSQTQSSDSPDAGSPETGSGDGGSASGTPNEDPSTPDWTVHNIRDLTGKPEDCKGN